MAHAKVITIKESKEELQLLYNKLSVHLRPRIKMLQYILNSIYAIDALSAKVGASRNSIAKWKKQYVTNGLLEDGRGGDYRSGIDVAGKQKIKDKLSDAKEAFKSFGEAQAWINKELGMNKNYHAVNKYLKRNFGAKLKVGRKSHIKKDEQAVAFFKNPVQRNRTY